MASTKVRGITIELGADTSGLSKALTGINKEIGSTQKQLKDVEKLLKLDPKNTELLEQKHRLLGDAIGDTKTKLDSLKQAQAEVSQKLAETGEGQAQYDALAREIISCEKELSSLTKAFYESNVAAQKLAAVGQDLDKMGGKIEGVGKKLMPVTAGITALGVEAVKITADFDTAMSQVKAISGATEDEFAQLRDKAREMGESTKFSATEAAEAMNYMAMAGWKTEDMLSGIEGIMNLAAASGEDLATTSDIVTDALTAFGLTAKDSGEFADLLAQTAANANTNVAMMGDTFKYAAPVMGAMGYSAEDAALAIGLMGNAGIKASSAGTALRGVISRMAKPTDEVQAAMDRLGISLYDDEGQMYSFYEIMQQMRDGFGEINISAEEYEGRLELLNEALENGSLTESKYYDALEELNLETFGAEEAEKARAAAMLAGKNALSGLLAIVNASDEDFNKLKTAIDGSGGAAENMAKTMQDNLGGQMTILKSQLQELAISFGDILVPTLRKVVDWLQGFMDKLNGMDEGTKETVVKIGLIVAALAPVLTVGGKLLSGIGSLLSFIPTLMGALGGLFSFIAANPIVLAITAIIAIIVLCIKHWDEIKAVAIEVWTRIVEVIQNAKDKIGTAFENIKNKVKTVFDNMWSVVKSVINKMLGGIEGMVNGFIRAINKMLSAVSKVASAVGSIFGLNPINLQLSEISLPRLAKGGILSNGSAIVGEAGAELLSVQNGQAMVQPLGGNQGASELTALLETYLPYLAQSQNIVMDSGALVGSIAGKMNNALGRMATRGAYV